jgi:hypothetical protein
MALDIFFPAAPAHNFGVASQFSPLVLADRLLSLAQEADEAGYHDSASRLLGLMNVVLDRGLAGRSN